MAECYLLLAFALLLMLGGWQAMQAERFAPLEPVLHLDRRHQAAVSHAARNPEVLTILDELRSVPQQDRIALAADLVEGAEPRQRFEAVAEERWRFVSPALASRVIAGLAELPPDAQSQLADLIELTEPVVLQEAISVAQGASGDRFTALEDGFRAAGLSERALIARLRDELGGTVTAAGGTITAEGAMVFPEGVLFEVGSARVRPSMLRTLQRVCPAWLQVLFQGGRHVAGARIEGHASSDWGALRGREAYLLNLGLSQARSAAVVETCLRLLPEGGALDRWAIAHLLAVGYSSARPVLVNGTEDPIKSRRVVFAIEFDRTTLLEQVQSEIGTNILGDDPLPDAAGRGMDGAAGP